MSFKFSRKFFATFQGQLLLLLALSTIIPVTLVGGYAAISSSNTLAKLAVDEEEEETGKIAEEISLYLEKVREDVLTFSKLPAIQGIVRAKANGGTDPETKLPKSFWNDALTDFFRDVMKEKPEYMQLRYLDEKGNEIVRVDSDGTQVKIIPQAQLQNKKDRSYFTDTMKLPAGELYVSDLDLNREGGQIEKPFKPVIRYATPIVDAAGNKKGIIIANIFAKPVIDFVKKAAEHHPGEEKLLVNKDGYYLANPNADKEWGFELKKEDKLSADFPSAIAQEVLSNKQGVISKGTDDFIGYSRIVIDEQGGKYLIVVNKLPKDSIFASVYSFEKTALLIGIISLAGVIPLGYWAISKASNLVDLVKQLIKGISGSSQEIFSTLEQQEQIVTDQAISVSHTTTTIDRLGMVSLQSAQQAEASASEARQALALAENGTKAVQQTMEGMTVLKGKVQAIAEQIVRLSEQTAQIGTISNLVGDLANQTNMLSLNAAVEAARAGEHGKGFAVVAAEIRKLADESKKSSQKINTLVTDIQTVMNSTVMVTDEGTKTADESIQLTQGTAETFVGMADAVNIVFRNNQDISRTAKEQAVAVQEVVAAINAINLGAQETAEGITQVKSSTEHLNEAAQKLQAVV